MMNLIACNVCGSPSSHLTEAFMIAAATIAASVILRVARRRQSI